MGRIGWDIVEEHFWLAYRAPGCRQQLGLEPAQHSASHYGVFGESNCPKVVFKIRFDIEIIFYIRHKLSFSLFKCMYVHGKCFNELNIKNAINVSKIFWPAILSS